MYSIQDKGFALGNFINCTPALKRLAEKQNKPIDVKFETPYVKECFIDCPFINHVDYYQDNPVINSRMINKSIPDYIFIFQKVTGEKWNDNYHTYVDMNFPNPDLGRYVLLINGSGSDRPGYTDAKNPGTELYNYANSVAKEKGFKTIFTGSNSDLKNNPDLNPEIVIDVNNIRRSLQLLQHAEFIIANDTGLAHAAGAMNKPILIFWKDTLFEKNINPGTHTVYSRKGTWQQMLDAFLKIYTY